MKKEKNFYQLEKKILSIKEQIDEIEASDEEVDAEVEKMIQDTTQNKDELKKVLNDPQIRESITQNLLTRKTLECLTGFAEVKKETKKPKTRRRKKEGG